MSGQRLGDYELVRRIAQGGMADVYLARRTGVGGFAKHVALKVLSADRARDADARAMFLDEARVVSHLEHRHIAAVLDVAVERGVHYLAMEYVHGCDLRDVLLQAQRKRTSLPYAVSVAIAAGAADGLHHAHSRCGADGTPLRLVHRDVSLSNLMVGYDGAVKVVDFGIARSTLASVHTVPGVVRGKAAYMAPEQCLGEPIDARTDVFALGVVLYELTTGLRCFGGATDFERMLAVVRGDFTPPRDLIPDYPAALEAVVCTALATDPAQRYATAAALRDALVAVGARYGWQLETRAIARAMHELFGEVPEPWVQPAAVAAEPDTDVVATLCAACAAQPSRSHTVAGLRRFARGSHVDLRRAEPPAEEDDEHLTGRRPRLTRRGYAVRSAA